MRTQALMLTPLLLTIATAAGPDDEAVGRIVGTALTESRAYEKLAWLTDRIGHRLSGSRNLQRAVAWTAEQLRRDGLERVWTEEVMVPRWVRGHERGRLVSPVERRLALLALGGSVPTPEGGLRGEVVLAHSIEEVEAMGERLRGKIVLYVHEMKRGAGYLEGYGPGARMRVHGASPAARGGAVAMLIRSLGTADYRLPHTGAMNYEDDAARIPGAAISVEDSMRIERLIAAGETVEVELDLGCATLPDAPSANVLAELRGRELPDEVVVIACHLDSWDVGDGAHDDGAGCAVVMESLRLLNKHGLVPRRSIRGILFTNEENGLRGGRDYAMRHRDEMERHVAAIESDSGGGAPLGFGVTAGPGAEETVREIARRLDAIGADRVTPEGGGADISPMKPYGVPQIGLRQDTTYYFDYHHTEADTLDKVERRDLDRNVAAMMLMAYELAEMDGSLPRVEEQSERP